MTSIFIVMTNLLFASAYAYDYDRCLGGGLFVEFFGAQAVRVGAGSSSEDSSGVSDMVPAIIDAKYLSERTPDVRRNVEEVLEHARAKSGGAASTFVVLLNPAQPKGSPEAIVQFMKGSGGAAKPVRIHMLPQRTLVAAFPGTGADLKCQKVQIDDEIVQARIRAMTAAFQSR